MVLRNGSRERLFPGLLSEWGQWTLLSLSLSVSCSISHLHSPSFHSTRPVRPLDEPKCPYIHLWNGGRGGYPKVFHCMVHSSNHFLNFFLSNCMLPFFEHPLFSISSWPSKEIDMKIIRYISFVVKGKGHRAIMQLLRQSKHRARGILEHCWIRCSMLCVCEYIPCYIVFGSGGEVVYLNSPGMTSSDPLADHFTPSRHKSVLREVRGAHMYHMRKSWGSG